MENEIKEITWIKTKTYLFVGYYIDIVSNNGNVSAFIYRWNYDVRLKIYQTNEKVDHLKIIRANMQKYINQYEKLLKGE